MPKIYEYDFTQRQTKKKLVNVAQIMIDAQQLIGFKMSTRGWCYWAEGERIINKDQFDKFEALINRCRKRGLLPIDFIAEEEGRRFSEVHVPYWGTHGDYIKWYLNSLDVCENYFDPDWWDGEEYYIQMVVEKIDMKTLFQPVCAKYHIPIATSKGWSSMIQRAIYAKRFKEAEEQGLTCVLLYCGDHDPDGLRISEFLNKNLDDLKNIYWSNGDEGYNPDDLIIDRFGLNRDFIEANNLTWIDNLITGSKRNLASPDHANYNMPYVQNYLRVIGERKCEANAIVTIPDLAKHLCRKAIEKYLGKTSLARFKKKEATNRKKIREIKDSLGITKYIEEIKEQL